VDAHLSSDGHWFSGLILRRWDRSAVGAATRSHRGSNDVTFGEAMGLNDAIDLVEKYRVTNVIFELDSQIVVNAVKRKLRVHKCWGAVIHRCVKFLQDNPNSSIVWTNRDRNRVAHALAKWAEMDPNQDWPNLMPSCIKSYIQKDIASLYSP
ncbi:60S ribosomal protein L23, partial [Trifolium medium]|nr:60S ribosomal protein L23 [Trifolium medium]